MSLKERAPSIYAALLDGSSVTPMSLYLATSYADEALHMIPQEVLKAAVALSTAAGSKIYVAAFVGEGNDYLRISIHGESVRYGSFEEFLVTEMDLMIEALRDSVDERMNS